MFIIIALVIILVSHLTIDKSFPPQIKTVSSVVFGILIILYLIFGIAV